LTVNAVKKLIEVYQQKYNRTIYFIDKDGDVKQAGSGFDENIKNIAQLEYYSQFKNDPGIYKGPQSLTYKKDNKVLHANIRYIEEFKWYLVVEQPEQATIKKIFTALWINIFICVAITIFILLLVNMSINAYKKRIDTLRGIVPICSFCKQIRDDKGYWNKVEGSVSKHTEAKFSHGICPTCMEKHYPEDSKK